MEKSLLAPGHRACAGCAMPTTIKLVLDAAGPNTIVVSPTGCLEVTTTPFPESAWCVPWIHSLFENASAVASGVEVMLKRKKKDANVIVIAGDGSTFDIGMGSNSGMFERGHRVLYVCYDNEAYMNTGVQRSGSTPFCVHTTTTPSGSCSQGNPLPKKDMPAIALAHKVPYVATASVAYPVDLRRKVKKALQVDGPSYIQVNSPCITGWTFDTGTMIQIARLAVETGLWPLTEYENGELTAVMKVRMPKPVAEYLRLQGRYKHLFKKAEGADLLARIQAIADANIARYNLVD
ncbi:MAG TPA: thiamine pyrophosphate-dependent enzyme [Methanothrix sp.]|nr:pyruvate ferredoxin oxidoreductase [Methanothrix sp.]HOV82175.1 thiamine pyrophosphate-dependent enzyme [Methanothrix sp.]HPC89091.1 thiamine pyrophosphate-dependent enzyme [Methanothrix sp.]HQE87162.1 thiamine pyrophosphate-dependent enzyme [Methanothrix sp.]HQI68865.1 thiamine pyrophosphate-dependent enzyme [Methanothrix sp.]